MNYGKILVLGLATLTIYACDEASRVDVETSLEGVYTFESFSCPQGQVNSVLTSTLAAWYRSLEITINSEQLIQSMKASTDSSCVRTDTYTITSKTASEIEIENTAQRSCASNCSSSECEAGAFMGSTSLPGNGLGGIGSVSFSGSTLTVQSLEEDSNCTDADFTDFGMIKMNLARIR